MIGQLVRRALAEKRDTDIPFDTFCQSQVARLRAQLRADPLSADDPWRGEYNQPKLPCEHFAVESRS